MRWLAIITLLVLVACGDFPTAAGIHPVWNDPEPGYGGDDRQTGGGGSGGEGGAGGQGGGAEGLTWSRCAEGFQCARFEQPLDRSDPSSPKVSLLLRRILAGGASRGQVWLLMGGPGYSAEGYKDLALWLASKSFDAYLPDYRGTPGSTPFACERAIEDNYGPLSETCLSEIRDQWGEGTSHFGTTDAALDVLAAIEITREPDVPVILYGASYGSFMAERVLNLDPQVAGAVVLDSAVHPDGAGFSSWDDSVEIVSHRLFDLCGADSFCSGKLGPDPWKRRVELEAALRQGHCSALGDAEALRRGVRRILGAAVGAADAAVGLSLVYRLLRCEDADVAALQLLRYYEDPLPANPGVPIAFGDPSFSPSLYGLIVSNEMWAPEMTPDRARAIDEESRLATIDAVIRLSYPMSRWPWSRYPTEPDFLRWAPVEVPVLLLQGELDVATNIEAVRDFPAAHAFAGQQMVVFPFRDHAIVRPRRAFDPDECGQIVMLGFLTDPTGTLDLSCIQDDPAADLRGSRRLAGQVYGTVDLWENGAQGISAEDPRTSEARARLDARLSELPRL